MVIGAQVARPGRCGPRAAHPRPPPGRAGRRAGRRWWRPAPPRCPTRWRSPPPPPAGRRPGPPPRRSPGGVSAPSCTTARPSPRSRSANSAVGQAVVVAGRGADHHRPPAATGSGEQRSQPAQQPQHDHRGLVLLGHRHLAARPLVADLAQRRAQHVQVERRPGRAHRPGPAGPPSRRRPRRPPPAATPGARCGRPGCGGSTGWWRSSAARRRRHEPVQVGLVDTPLRAQLVGGQAPGADVAVGRHVVHAELVGRLEQADRRGLGRGAHATLPLAAKAYRSGRRAGWEPGPSRGRGHDRGHAQPTGDLGPPRADGPHGPLQPRGGHPVVGRLRRHLHRRCRHRLLGLRRFGGHRGRDQGVPGRR